VPSAQPRLLSEPVLRGWAERLQAAAAPGHGEVALDSPCAGGLLSATLARRSAAWVLACDASADELAVAAGEVAAIASGRRPSLIRAESSALPLGDAVVDACVSLFTLPLVRSAPEALRELLRILRPRGRLVCAAWGDAARTPHEAVLAAACEGVLGRRSDFVDRTLSLGRQGAPERLIDAAGAEPRVRAVRVRDVVRFDGITHYWQAMVAVRPVAGELAGESPDVLAALRADCERRLRSWTAADGTMRIPVEVVLLLAGVEATP